MAREHNVLLVVAAGDRGEDLQSVPQYPAVFSHYPHLITVAALDKFGELSTLYPRRSNFSNIFVDIAAPGEKLIVAAPRNEYLERSGSDIAAAHVVGAAALLFTLHPNSSASEIKQWLLDGAKENTNLSDKVAKGRMLNIANAINVSLK